MLKSLKKNIINNENIIFIFSNLFAHFLNYAINIFLGYFFCKYTYGLISSLFSLIHILALPTIILQTMVSNLISEKNERKSLILNFFLINSILLGIFIFLICLLFSSFISNLLHTLNIYIYFVGLIILSSLPLSVLRGYLQGTQKFAKLGISFFIDALSKVVLTILFLTYFHWSVLGVLFAILIASIVAFTYTLYQVGIKNIKLFFRMTDKCCYLKSKENFKYFIYLFIAISAIITLTNIDVIFVQHFIPKDSGYYGVYSRLGQIMFMISTIFTSIFVPKIISEHAKKTYKFSYLHGLTVLFFTEFIIFLLYWFYPDFVISTLFGKKYLTSENYLGIMAIAYFFISLSFYGIQYLIGLRYFIIVSCAILSLTLYILLGFMHNSSFYDYIVNLLMSSFALFVLVNTHALFLYTKISKKIKNK